MLVQTELIIDEIIPKEYPDCMPRQPRLDAPGTLHHVIGRGTASLVNRMVRAKEVTELDPYHKKVHFEPAFSSTLLNVLLKR